MRIESSFDQLQAPKERIQKKTTMTTTRSSRMKKRERPTYSKSSIREKIELRNIKKSLPTKTPLAAPKKEIQQIEVKSLGVEEKTKKTPNALNSNDPGDPVTKEKLKSLLRRGAFNFSAKERETLGKIVN